MLRGYQMFWGTIDLNLKIYREWKNEKHGSTATKIAHEAEINVSIYMNVLTLMLTLTLLLFARGIHKIPKFDF